MAKTYNKEYFFFLKKKNIIWNVCHFTMSLLSVYTCVCLYVNECVHLHGFNLITVFFFCNYKLLDFVVAYILLNNNYTHVTHVFACIKIKKKQTHWTYTYISSHQYQILWQENQQQTATSLTAVAATTTRQQQ